MFSRRLPPEQFTIDCDSEEAPFKAASRVCQEHNFVVLRHVFTDTAFAALRHDTALHVFNQEHSKVLNRRMEPQERVEWTNELAAKTEPAKRRFRPPHPWLSMVSLASITRLAAGFAPHAQEYPRIALPGQELTTTYGVRYPHEGFVPNHQDSRPGLFAEIALDGTLLVDVAAGDRPRRRLAQCVLSPNDVLLMPGVVEGFRDPEHRVYHQLRNITEDNPLNSNRQLSLVVGFGDDTVPPVAETA